MTVFEDVFSDAQTEMVSMALRYANGEVSDVFIQFTIQGNMCGVGLFYVKDAKVVRLEDRPVAHASYEIRRSLVSQMTDEVHRISLACAEANRPVPVEGYLHYRVAPNSLDARHSYDEIHDDDEDPVRSQRFFAWQREVQQELDSV